jgi:hypothetical protein
MVAAARWRLSLDVCFVLDMRLDGRKCTWVVPFAVLGRFGWISDDYIPRLARTYGTVRSRIFTSDHSDHPVTYR